MKAPQETLSSVLSTVSGCAVNKAHVVLILGIKKKVLSVLTV